MAEFVEAGAGVAGAGEGEYGERESGTVKSPAEVRVEIKFHCDLLSRPSAAEAAV